jgi:hypothetical protein
MRVLRKWRIAKETQNPDIASTKTTIGCVQEKIYRPRKKLDSLMALRLASLALFVISERF